jgi:hypothetical protein
MSPCCLVGDFALAPDCNATYPSITSLLRCAASCSNRLSLFSWSQSGIKPGTCRAFEESGTTQAVGSRGLSDVVATPVGASAPYGRCYARDLACPVQRSSSCRMTLILQDSCTPYRGSRIRHLPRHVPFFSSMFGRRTTCSLLRLASSPGQGARGFVYSLTSPGYLGYQHIPGKVFSK